MANEESKYIVRQIRYFPNGSAYYGSNTVDSELTQVENTLFVHDEYGPIVKLGVQSYPGMKFTINWKPDFASVNEPYILGRTGVYEFDSDDSKGDIKIDSLSFDKDSIAKLKNIEGGYLIVDIVQERKG